MSLANPASPVNLGETVGLTLPQYSLAPHLPGALITTYDGIVGPWPQNGPEQGPGDVPADVDARMRRWEARVRAHVLDFELLSAFIVKSDTTGTQPTATLLVRDEAAVSRACEIGTSVRGGPSQISARTRPQLCRFAARSRG